MNKVELLAPAGDFEKLKIAIAYGADAVYLGGKNFGLRSGSGNFDIKELTLAVDYAHKNKVKVYLTLNIFSHNNDIHELKEYLLEIKDIDIDAYIISDPAILSLVKEISPDKELHLSTQANCTNYISANFWHAQGFKRIVLARELSLQEIKEVIDNKANTLEIESFIHGAMCMSYSGRCLLSNYMTKRDANKGDCSQPCRWKYTLVEEQRPTENYEIEEDERGTYIMNSKDLCMINEIDKIIDSGIYSLKIEGRMKTIYYLANTLRVYRKAIDDYISGKTINKEELYKELTKASYRGFTTGFYFDSEEENMMQYNNSSYIRDYDFIGIVKGYDKEKKHIIVEQRYKFTIGDEIEVIGPNYFSENISINKIYNEDNIEIESAPHPKQIIKIPFDKELKENYILRKKKL